MVKLLLATSMQPSVLASDSYFHCCIPNKITELIKVTYCSFANLRTEPDSVVAELITVEKADSYSCCFVAKE